MKPIIQPGTHPDAEVLTAFAEQLVTGTEREQILAHMVECSRCREVVFLAQQACETEELARSAAEVPGRKGSRRWFTPWRWAWIPVAALAGLVGFAVLRHVNRASVSETRMAQNGAPPEMTQNPAPSKAAVTPSPEPSAPAREESRHKSSAPARLDRGVELDRKSLSDKDGVAAQKKDELAESTDSLSAAAPKVTGGAVHGTFEARAKSSAIGGPMPQNQVQQQNNAQLQEQNDAREVRQTNAPTDSANKPAPSAIQAPSASETVTLEAGGGPVPVSPAPSSAPVFPAMQAESVAVSGKNLGKLKAAESALPSNLGIVSQAAVGKRMIAIDTAGSVFQSDDAGKHWATVNTQWTGRAVLVKPIPASGQVAGNVLSQPAVQFELLTDTFGTWTSTDGKIWTLKLPVPK
jgi:hypothetical protein